MFKYIVVFVVCSLSLFGNEKSAIKDFVKYTNEVAAPVIVKEKKSIKKVVCTYNKNSLLIKVEITGLTKEDFTNNLKSIKKGIADKFTVKNITHNTVSSQNDKVVTKVTKKSLYDVFREENNQLKISYKYIFDDKSEILIVLSSEDFNSKKASHKPSGRVRDNGIRFGIR